MPTAVRTERQGADDVLTAAHPAVEEHGNVFAHGLHHLTEHVNRRRGALQGAAPVVGNHHPGRARRQAAFGVLGAEDALDDHRAGRTTPASGGRRPARNPV